MVSAKSNGPPTTQLPTGLAERAVQTFKESMKRSSGDSLNTCVQRFLFRYRITPHTTTGIAPAQLLLGRLPCSHLYLLKPNVATCVQSKQNAQKTSHNVQGVSDSVFVHTVAAGALWIPGKVMKVNGPLSYMYLIQDHN